MYFTELHITPFSNHHLSYILSAHLKNACASSLKILVLNLRYT